MGELRVIGVSQRVGLPLAYLAVLILSSVIAWLGLRLVRPDKLKSLHGTPADRAQARPMAVAAIVGGSIAAVGTGELFPGAAPRSFPAWLIVATATVAALVPGLWLVMRWARREFGDSWWRSVDFRHPLPAGNRGSQIKYLVGMATVLIGALVATMLATELAVF